MTDERAAMLVKLCEFRALVGDASIQVADLRDLLAAREQLRRELAAAQRECERLQKHGGLQPDEIERFNRQSAEVERLTQERDFHHRNSVTMHDELARANKAIRKMGETCDAERDHYKKCISAMAWRCAKYHEAVALLRRLAGMWGGTFVLQDVLDEATYFLATIDAEEAKLSKD